MKIQYPNGVYYADGEFYPNGKNEYLACSVADSIKKLANDPDNLGNFVSYLTSHFSKWLAKMEAPEDFADELRFFADIKPWKED